MDAITLLKTDHRTVEELFTRFEKLGPRARKGKRDLVDRIVKELSVHASAEETVLYPAIRAAVEASQAGNGDGAWGSSPEDVDATVLESLEEHHVVKWTLSELEDMDPTHERFDAKVKVLMESVRHHVKEEESMLFPKLRKAFGKDRLNELGDALAAAKKVAPTRPHPRMPDEPPGNVLAAPGTALVDKAFETGRRVLRQKAGTRR